MHLSVFQARAFGYRRLPPREAAAVVRHLDTGCGPCRARLAPWLIPWLDPAPASEARATDPAAACGPGLAAEYRLAARRAARAAMHLRAEEAARADDRETRRVLLRLDREGPAAIRRLPRRLLGRPAAAALLRQIELRGIEHPRFRLRLAEMAWDLASRLPGLPGAERQLPPLAVAAGIELANAYRVIHRLGSARAWLDAMRGHLAAGSRQPRLVARLEEIQAALEYSTGSATASHQAAERSATVSRRAAEATALARALCVMGLSCNCCVPGLENRTASAVDAVRLCDPERSDNTHVYAIGNLCCSLANHEEWSQARVLIDRHRRELDTIARGHRAVDWLLKKGLILDHAHRYDEALHAYASARAECVTLGDRYREATTMLSTAATLEHRGDAVQSANLVRQGADLLLAGNPRHEVYVTATLLRLRGHFSNLRESLRLDGVRQFLEHARIDPTARLASFVG